MGFTVLILNLFIFVIALFIIYRIIFLAVREGINQSVIGKFIRNKSENQKNNEIFKDNNLDNN